MSLPPLLLFVADKSYCILSQVSGIAVRSSALSGWRVKSIHSNPLKSDRQWSDGDDDSEDVNSEDDDNDLDSDGDSHEKTMSTFSKEKEEEEEEAEVAQTSKSARKVGRIHHVNADGTGSLGKKYSLIIFCLLLTLMSMNLTYMDDFIKDCSGLKL